MITFEQFLAEGLIGYHSTTDDGFKSIELNGFQPQPKEERLFPGTISFTLRRNTYGGKRCIRAELDVQEDQILRLTMQEFWSKAETHQTPVQIGKLWVKDALKQGKRVIILKNVPGIGTEIAVLDKDIIGKTKEVTS